MPKFSHTCSFALILRMHDCNEDMCDESDTEDTDEHAGKDVECEMLAKVNARIRTNSCQRKEQ